MSTIENLWHSTHLADWEEAAKRYMSFVKSANRSLELRLENLNTRSLEKLDALGWYRFLKEEYFRWKFTDARLYKQNIGHFERFVGEVGIESLNEIKKRLVLLEPSNTLAGVILVKGIRGLGTAGATGLLSLLFPENFGTVDQFVVKALQSVSRLPEQERLRVMKPKALTPPDGVVLIEIMKRKATELNALCKTSEWNPRKLDKILWTYGRNRSPAKAIEAPTKAWAPNRGEVPPLSVDVNASALTNHDKIKLAMESYKGQVMTTAQIGAVVRMEYRHFPEGSLLPNDHADGNKSCCWCARTESRIFDRIKRGEFLVR